MGRETHKKLINRAAKHFIEKNYTVFREAKMTGKTRIDILAIKGSERVGLECQLTISYSIIKSKIENYGKNLTKIIFVVPEAREAKLITVMNRISKEDKIPKNFFEIWTEDVDVTTTIRISKKAKERLDAVAFEIGKFGETYDDILEKLIESYKKYNHKKGEK